MRARYTTLEYTAVAYTMGAVTAIPLTVLAGINMVNLTLKAWMFIVLVTLIPMLGGHTLINYVIGRLSLLATTVPVLGEPVSQEVAIFMALTLSGILMVLVWEERRKSEGRPPTS